MTAVYIALGVLVLLAILYLFLVFPALRRHPDRQLLDGMLIAHRGLHDLKADTPENSLAAFHEAVKAELAIEIDIHLTADGEVVVFHDDTPERMCGVDGKVESFTLKQLRALRLQGTEEGIPTLRECLAVVSGKVPLMIEFKCGFDNWKALCEAAEVILRDYDGPYFVQSFFPLALWWYRRNRPDICRGQLSSRFSGGPLLHRLQGLLLFNVLARPDFVSYDQNHADAFPLQLNIALGAFPVGWTFTSQPALNRGYTRFKTYIFESFIPDELALDES